MPAKTSLATVGATTSIIFLLVTLFNGVSIGTNYLTARYYGAGDQEAISQTVHCSAVLSVILGLMAGVVGFFSPHRRWSWPGLQWMSCRSPLFI